MTVKYEDEIYECLKKKDMTTNEVINETGRSRDRVWTALTQLEQKKMVRQINTVWVRCDEHS